MYQRLYTLTRMFRERWGACGRNSLSFAYAISTADAAVYPTLGGVRGRGGICCLPSVWRVPRICGSVRLRPVRVHLACGAW